jgi:hypothetical protein
MGVEGRVARRRGQKIAAWTSPCAIKNRPATQRIRPPGRQNAYVDRSGRDQLAFASTKSAIVVRISA